MTIDIFSAIANAAKSFGLNYSKKNIIHTLRLETDDLVICTPKIIRKRHMLFLEKVLRVHDHGNDDITIIDIK